MIHLYAEHLLNIRTLSVQAVLPTVSNKETKATLSADGSILTLTHEGESASIKLPINLSPNRPSKVILTIPAVPSRELSFRIQLEEKEGAVDGVLSNCTHSETGNVVPWTANSLSHDTEICCNCCGNVLVERGNVREWKDLPSEGWAEMMEFWHCHKPDEPHLDAHLDSKKGYTANSRLALESGVGMVDVADFLLAAEDCQNLVVGWPSLSLPSPLFPITFLKYASKQTDKKRTGALAPQGNFHGRQSGYNESKIEPTRANPESTSRKRRFIW